MLFKFADKFSKLNANFQIIIQEVFSVKQMNTYSKVEKIYSTFYQNTQQQWKHESNLLNKLNKLIYS